MSLPAALRQQATSCAGLGSPFMARLLTLLADRLRPDSALTRRLFDWPGDIGPNGASVPLRLAGALHALVLQGHPLATAYPPHQADDETLWQAVESALHSEGAFLDAFVDNPPQTNEVRRSAALIAAGHWLAARHPLPFILSELGASAGLNLLWDRYALATPQGTLGPANPALTLTPDWTGPLPPATPITVTERAGCDLNPLTDPQRLLAYLWPDQPHRRTLTEAALRANPPTPHKSDAIDWLEPRLTPHPGHLHLIWTTIAWQYFPAPAQSRGTALIEAAGRRATPAAPLAWLSYEADGHNPGAALTLRLWPGDLTIPLGRADFHGRWIDWHAR